MVFIKKKNLTKDISEGFTLLGVLISAFIAIVVVSAIAAISAQTYDSSRISRDRFVAVGLAKEGIELVRNIRDGNWMFYPQLADTPPVTKMEWRGRTGNVIFTGDGGVLLKSLCNGDYAVNGLRTLSVPSSFLEPIWGSYTGKLYMDNTATSNNGFYTLVSSGNIATPFTRVINISTSGSGDCGEMAESDSDEILYKKPNPMTVKSTVSWNDSRGNPHTVVLEETLYDWMLQRP